MFFWVQQKKCVYISFIRLTSVLLLIYSASFSTASSSGRRQAENIKPNSLSSCRRLKEVQNQKNIPTEFSKCKDGTDHSSHRPICDNTLKSSGESTDLISPGYQVNKLRNARRAQLRGSMSGNVRSHLPPSLLPNDIQFTSRSAFTLVNEQQVQPDPSEEASSLMDLGSKPMIIRSGDIEILQNRHVLGAFEVLFRGHLVAVGQDNPIIEYILNGKSYTVQVQKYEATAVRMSQGGMRLNSAIQDQNGVRWGIYQNFFPGPDSSIKVHCLVTVSKPCRLEYLPIITMLPGKDNPAFRTKEALLPGVAYLGSHELNNGDTRKTDSVQLPLIPDANEITFPLMTIVGNYGYLSLTWRQSPHVAALFACPDRVHHSNSSVLGLVAPGTEISNREPGKLLATPGLKMTPGITIGVNARIMCGEGLSVVPAVKEYVKEYGIPGIPSTHMSAMQYLSLAANGWLQSNITASPLYRQAWMTDSNLYPPKPAADVAMDMLYDSTFQNNLPISTKLVTAANSAFSVIPKNNLLSDQISELNSPAAALVDLHAMSEAQQAYADAVKELENGSGTLSKPGENSFHERTGKADFVDGDAAEKLWPLLQNSLLCGNPEIKNQALQRLKMLDSCMNRLPRMSHSRNEDKDLAALGASASLCRDYTLGYALTGDASLLTKAEYWAWTGVPFVYLVSPNSSVFGDYGTKANFSIHNNDPISQSGLLDQRRGMVYADALWLLSKYDLKHRSQWTEIAKGIAASGVIQTWPQGDMNNGLLPDSCDISKGTRSLPAFNPCIVFSGATRLYGLPTEYSFAVCDNSKTIIHAPGEITIQRDTSRDISFSVRCWPHKICQILVAGLSNQPAVYLNGNRIPSSQFKYNSENGWLVLPILENANVEIKKP